MWWRLNSSGYGEESPDLVGEVDEAECFELVKPGENHLVDKRLIEERSAVGGLNVGKQPHDMFADVPGKIRAEDSYDCAEQEIAGYVSD